MKRTLLTLLVLITMIPLYAQLTYEKRVELDGKFEQERLYKFGDDKLIKLARKYTLGASTGDKQIQVFDKDLNLLKEEVLELSSRARVLGIDTIKDKIYFHFTSAGAERIVSIDEKTNEISVLEFKRKTGEYYQDFFIWNERAHFRVRHLRKMKVSYAMSIDLKTGHREDYYTLINGLEEKKNKINIIAKVNKDIILVCSNFDDRERSKSYRFISLLDTSRKKVGGVSLFKEDGRSVVSVRATEIEDNKYLITGTYKGKGKQPFKSGTIGCFFSVIEEGKPNVVEVYPYPEFSNWGANRLGISKEKMEALVEKQKGKGEQLIFERNVYHRLSEVLNDGCLLAYETYVAKKESISDGQGGSELIFSGFEYHGVVLMKVDFEGKLVWEQYVETRLDYIPYFLGMALGVRLVDNKYIEVGYEENNEWKYKRVDLNGDIVKTDDAVKGNEKVKDIKKSTTKTLYWYDDYYILYGRAELEKKNKQKGKRKVFFMSKVRFR